VLLRSLPLPGEGNIGEDGEEVRLRKKRRGERRAVVEADEEPRTVEDLEALAVGLLAG